MAKRKTVKILTNEDKKKHLAKTKKAIDEGFIVTIKPDAIITLPVVGKFRDYITEMLNYLFTIKDEAETIRILAHIRSGFKDVPEDAPYDPYMNAIWTCMTLISEINHQAAEQGHTIVTKEKINENISTFVNSMESGDLKTTEKVFKDMAGNYKEAMDKADIKKSDVDGEKAGKTSNED